MTSVVAICNLAAARIRAGQIQDLGEQTLLARECTRFYQPSRDFVLADAPWGFNKKIGGLAQLSETPVEWEYAYAYPSDAVSIRYLTSDSKMRHRDDRVEFEIALSTTDSKVILTNLDDAYAAWGIFVTDPNLFSHGFVQALSWFLAAEIAIPVVGTTKGRALRDDALTMYRAFRLAAGTHDGNEGYEGDERDPAQIRAYS